MDHVAKMGCRACPLSKADLMHPKISAVGSTHPKIYYLGEAPGEEEDREGVPFVGRAGRLLRSDIQEDIPHRIHNCARCRPTDGMKNRDPTDIELAACRSSVEEDITWTKPKVIVALGNVAMKWTLGVSGIKQWRGRYVPARIGDHVCWVFPCLHPSFINRQGSEGRDSDKLTGDDWKYTFHRDLWRVQNEIDRLPECEGPKGPDGADADIELCTGSDKSWGDLDRFVTDIIAKGPLITGALDLETVGLRPYAEGAKVLTASISDGSRTMSFPIDHPEASRKFRDRATTILRRFVFSSAAKVAHNLPFELEWLAWLFGEGVLRVGGWDDTMAGEYVLDVRDPDTLDLGFCTMHRFGFDVKSLSPLDKKKLAGYRLADVLRYNGLDSKWTALLLPVILDEIRKQRLQQAYRLQIERVPTLVWAQKIGLVVNKQEVEANLKKYTSIEKQSLSVIEADKDVKRFVRLTGEFNPYSVPQVVGFFRDFLKLDAGRRRDKYSTDDDALIAMKHPVAAALRKARAARKMCSTYVENLSVGGKDIYPDGRVHTSFKPCWTSTTRLASESLNMQNWPKRDGDQKELRRQIDCPPGFEFLCADYGQIEYRIIAEDSGDPVIQNALFDGFDVHQYWAEKLADAYPSLLQDRGGRMKDLRRDTKSNLVFPAFYLSSLEACAARLGMPVRILAPVFEDFWEMFKGVKAWQGRVLRFFDQYGYVKSITGRRRWAPMSNFMKVNTPIQSAASDIVIDASNRIFNRVVENDLWRDILFVINIHDDLSFYVRKSMFDELLELVVDECLHPTFIKLRVPLSIEVTRGPNWLDQEDVGAFDNVEEMKRSTT